MIGFAELTNWLTLGGSPVLLDINSGSLFHILTIAEYGILDLLAFLMQSLAAFHEAPRSD